MTDSSTPRRPVDLVKRDQALPEPAILDAELVDDEPAPDTSPDSGPSGGGLVVRPDDVVDERRRTPREHAIRAGRGGLRAGWATLQGFASWYHRAAGAITHGTVREQLRAAKATGNEEVIGRWHDRLQDAKDNRLERLVTLPRAILAVLAVAGLIAGVTLLLLFLVGVALWLVPGGAGWSDWWGGVGWWIDFLAGLVVVAFWLVVLSAGPLTLVAAWQEGRRAAAPPAWLRTAAEADADVVIDETTIARALDALRIPQISQHLKAGLPLQYLTGCRTDGRGTHAVIRLPHGVPAEKIAKRRPDLATGLHRLAKEVFPKTGSEEGILDIWIADKGALAEGAGPYPLLLAGEVDVWRGVPFGKNLRGEPVKAPVMERNTICGGMPGQGKSSAARAIMAGASLDITAELQIFVPDANFDFECFRPRCSRYVMGAEDEDIAKILGHLRKLHADVQVRGQLLVRYGIPAVNRDIAAQGVGLHPVFVLLEEAHVAIQHPKYGAEISKLLVDIVRLGRKRGIHMIVSTQAPTKDSMPRDVTRNCSNGIAFAVGDHVANDGLLGQGAYKAGHRATELIPGTDIGTALVKGFSGQRSEVVQVYYLDVSTSNDQVSPIIARSLELLERAGLPVPGTGRRDAVAELAIERDLLEDLDAVLGQELLPIADVPPLLAAHAPAWQPYRSLTGKALRGRLAERYGLRVPSTGNRYPLDPAAVRSALAERKRADQALDGDAEDGA